MNINKIFKTFICCSLLFLITRQLNSWHVTSIVNQSYKHVTVRFVSEDEIVEIKVVPRAEVTVEPHRQYPKIPDGIRLETLVCNPKVTTFLLIQIDVRSWISAECILDNYPSTWIQQEGSRNEARILWHSRGAISVRSSDGIKRKLIITPEEEITV